MMPQAPALPCDVTLRDARTMHLRLARPDDVAPIAQAHPLPEASTMPERALRTYFRGKALVYVRTPGAGVLTGWVGEELAGFVFFCADLQAVSRAMRSPRSMLWAAKEALLGRFGWSPRFWFQMLLTALQHMAQSRVSSEVVFGSRQAQPELAAWVPTVHTMPQFRRLGVASALMDAVEALLAAEGASAVALWVAVDNEAATNLYLRRGYRELALVRRVGEDCRLLIKDLTASTEDPKADKREVPPPPARSETAEAEGTVEDQ